MRWTSSVPLLLAAVAGALPPVPSPGAEPAWLRAATANFELFTADGRSRARDAIGHFEHVRSFISSAWTGLRLPAYPVRIVGFRSGKEFRPYRPFEGVVAYYHSDPRRATIVDLGFEEDAKAAASRLLQMVSTAEERESARQLADSVSRSRRQPVRIPGGAAPASGAASAADGGDVAALPVPPAGSAPEPPEQRVMEGLQVQVDCLNPGARLWLQARAGKQAFELPQGDKITLFCGGQDVIGDLQCGPQSKPDRVTIR